MVRHFLPLLVAVAVPGPAAHATTPADTVPVAPAIARLVRAGRVPGMRWPALADVQADLASLYDGRSWRPLWLEGGRASPAAQAAVAALDVAERHGLDPEDYESARLGAWAARLAADEEAARFDVALSAALLRLVRSLHSGQVGARAAGAILRLSRAPFDRVAAVRAIAGGARPDSLLAAVVPRFRHYALLVEALARYRALAADTALGALPPLPRRLRPGSAWSGVPALRHLLAALGDVPAGRAGGAGDTLYDDALAEAVRRFQARQGLTADGLIGDSTAARLRRPFAAQVRQLALTLERWRWLPDSLAPRTIVVNIPAFRLYALASGRDEEAATLAMNVVVGRSYRHRTPTFAAALSTIVFRPFWDVPAAIARKEIRPGATPARLAREGYELLEGERVVPPVPANLAAIGERVRVRQRPGPGNALGAVKFLFPNEHAVYLHDTPARELFARSRRDFSHGCIRVAEPAALAWFLLEGQPGWSRARVDSAMTREAPLTVPLARAAPVLIVYATAVAREDGSVYFYGDVYGYDRALDRALRRGFAPPG